MSGPAPAQGVRALSTQAVREALRLLGQPEAPGRRAAALRELGAALSAPGFVRALLAHAPTGAREAFIRVAQDGPATVEDLLDRGWWGHGTLPPPLDWLQRRALVAVGDDGRVHAVEEAGSGFLDLTLEVATAEELEHQDEIEILAAGCVVSTADPELLRRVLAVPDTGLRALAPTVALSSADADAVAAAFAAAGIRLGAGCLGPAGNADEAVGPGAARNADEAVGPGPVRRLLHRALSEGRQVRLEYFASSRGGAPTDRVVDPWAFADDLLRGYCHLRAGERTFALDRVGHARLLTTAIDHPDDPPTR